MFTERKIKLDEALPLLERCGKEYVKKQGGESAETPPEDVLDAAERYIREHISVDISVEAVAKEAHVSRVGYSNYSYFIKQFRKYHGMTPREYQKKQEQ